MVLALCKTGKERYQSDGMRHDVFRKWLVVIESWLEMEDGCDAMSAADFRRIFG